MLGKSESYAVKNSGSTYYLNYKSSYRSDNKTTEGYTSQLTQREQTVLRGLTRIDETADGKNEILVTTRQDRLTLSRRAEDETLRNSKAKTKNVDSAVGSIDSSVLGSTDGEYKPANLIEFLAKSYAEKNGLDDRSATSDKEVGQNLTEVRSNFDLDSINSLAIAPPLESLDNKVAGLRQKDEDPENKSAEKTPTTKTETQATPSSSATAQNTDTDTSATTSNTTAA